MSSPIPADQPPRTRRASTFQTRALAVRAAHRLATSGSELSLGSSVSPSTTTSPLLPAEGHLLDVDTEYENESALIATPMSENGPSRKVHFSPDSPFRITGAGGSRRASHSSRLSSDSRGQAPAPGDLEAGVNSRLRSTKARYKWLSPGRGGTTGDEPGVDVRSKRDEEGYGHLTGRADITVVDYSSNPEADDTNLVADFTGERLAEWLETDGQDRPLDDNGKITGVRWIHINGLNWEVIKTLTLQYGLHPLAVEDALRSHNSPRSKLDFYRSHLYLQILVQHLHREDAEVVESEADDALGGIAPEDREDHMHGNVGLGAGPRPGLRRRRSSIAAGGRLQRLREMFGGNRRRILLPEGVEGVFEPSIQGGRRGHSMYQKEAHRQTVNQLSARYMVPIRRGVMSMFMTRDGTVITLMRRPIREMLRPIYERLEDEQSLLRRSGDPSMLAQALLDISADLAVEVSQTFEAEILRLESSVLVDPRMETVRHLHVLSSQLIRLRRSITPLLHITSNIRDQDIQRSAAASAIRSKDDKKTPVGPSGLSVPIIELPTRAPMSTPGWATPREEPGSMRSFYPQMSAVNGHSSQLNMSPGAGGNGAVEGFFSPMTKVYVGDVLDHLEMVVSSLDQFVATCDHLTDYVFNVLSFQMNVSMERLSIVSVIFLPLTFISSYYGMNFEEFPDIVGSVSWFWKVAIPCTSAFFIIFSYSYIFSFFETVGRRVESWRRKKRLQEEYNFESEK